DEQEVGVRLEDLTLLVDGEDVAVVGERVDEHGRVLARLDDLVEVAYGARLDRLRERPVHPDRLVALDEVAADQVAAGEVLVTGDGDQVAVRAAVVGRAAELERPVLA